MSGVLLVLSIRPLLWLMRSGHTIRVNEHEVLVREQVDQRLQDKGDNAIPLFAEKKQFWNSHLLYS